MARSSRRTQHLGTCISTEPVVLDEGTPNERKATKYNWKPLCGDKYGSSFSYVEGKPPYGYATYPEAHDLCTKCSSKHWAAALSNTVRRPDGTVYGYKLGDRLVLSNNHEDKPKQFGIRGYDFKSVYPVIDISMLAHDNEKDHIVAFVCIENGWGESWMIRGWQSGARLQDVKDGGTIPEPELGDVATYTKIYKSGGYDGKPETTTETKMEAKRFASKEYALAHIADMMERGQLRTRQAVIRSTEEFVAKHKEDEAQREADRAERDRIRAELADQRQKDKDAIHEAFMEMLEEGQISNFQRDALFLAAKRLEIDLTAPSPFKLVGEAPVVREITGVMDIENEDDISDGGAADLMAPPVVQTDEWGEVIS